MENFVDFFFCRSFFFLCGHALLTSRILKYFVSSLSYRILYSASNRTSSWNRIKFMARLHSSVDVLLFSTFVHSRHLQIVHGVYVWMFFFWFRFIKCLSLCCCIIWLSVVFAENGGNVNIQTKPQTISRCIHSWHISYTYAIRFSSQYANSPRNFHFNFGKCFFVHCSLVSDVGAALQCFWIMGVWIVPSFRSFVLRFSHKSRSKCTRSVHFASLSGW